MIVIAPQTSGVKSDHSTNWATTIGTKPQPLLPKQQQLLLSYYDCPWASSTSPKPQPQLLSHNHCSKAKTIASKLQPLPNHFFQPTTIAPELQPLALSHNHCS